MTSDAVVLVYSSSVMDCNYVIFDEILRLDVCLTPCLFTLVLDNVSF